MAYVRSMLEDEPLLCRIRTDIVISRLAPWTQPLQNSGVVRIANGTPPAD